MGGQGEGNGSRKELRSLKSEPGGYIGKPESPSRHSKASGKTKSWALRKNVTLFVNISK